MRSTIKIGLGLRFKNIPEWKVSWDVLYREHLQFAAAADRLGFDGIWVPEHHCMETGYNPAPLLALTAIAGVTKRCWLGTQPLVMPLHHPVLAAEEAAVLDVISGGRLILGLGTGYAPADFNALGVKFEDRGELSEECLGIIRRALSAEAFDFKGKFYDLKGVKLSPPPVQKKMKIQLAARSKVAAKRAIRHGLDVNVLTRDMALELAPTIIDLTSQLGRDSKSVGVSILEFGFIGGTRDAAAAASRPYLRYLGEEYVRNAGDNQAEKNAALKIVAAIEQGTIGPFTAAEWIETIFKDVEAIESAGLRADWINVNLFHAGMPLSQALDAVECFAAEVLPHLIN
jgi:alkanesulfonate monooxygenase SsuD/methylene tetrahydromethanopterin reductase-like flavin-dependent oxidoreductase (luciferase family)